MVLAVQVWGESAAGVSARAGLPEADHVMTETQVEATRLHLLRELYAEDRIDLKEYGRCVDVVLAGEQPSTPGGLPFMPDPALHYPPSSEPIKSDTMMR